MYMRFGLERVIGHELAGVRADGTGAVVEALYGCMECDPGLTQQSRTGYSDRRGADLRRYQREPRRSDGLLRRPDPAPVHRPCPREADGAHPGPRHHRPVRRGPGDRVRFRA
ncbi:conserved hypothetical protein [Parafrankia sp. Ea1.12]|nr:conserved hypothetical protein [Parafrankia sp. Ea1.12]